MLSVAGCKTGEWPHPCKRCRNNCMLVVSSAWLQETVRDHLVLLVLGKTIFYALNAEEEYFFN